ncbi:MAG: hypothetical protein HN940_10440 [Planctomycetes bacterium]|jgi:hypothetical protein|nr:hypothetical protein [Planctomycetota bacterium]
MPTTAGFLRLDSCRSNQFTHINAVVDSVALDSVALDSVALDSVALDSDALVPFAPPSAWSGSLIPEKEVAISTGDDGDDGEDCASAACQGSLCRGTEAIDVSAGNNSATELTSRQATFFCRGADPSSRSAHL